MANFVRLGRDLSSTLKAQAHFFLLFLALVWCSLGRTHPALVEDVEDLVAEGRVEGVGTPLLVPEQGLQQSGELVDVQRVVPARDHHPQ